MKIILAAIVIKSPGCSIAKNALDELKVAACLFDEGSKPCNHPQALVSKVYFSVDPHYTNNTLVHIAKSPTPSGGGICYLVGKSRESHIDEHSTGIWEARRAAHSWRTGERHPTPTTITIRLSVGYHTPNLKPPNSFDSDQCTKYHWSSPCQGETVLSPAGDSPTTFHVQRRLRQFTQSNTYTS